MTDILEPQRRLLPFLHSVRHGSRSHATCFYKCGNACDSAIPNQTDNPTFAEVVQTAFSRRNLLKAAGASALVVAAGPMGTAAASDRRGGPGGPAGSRGDLTFQPVGQNLEDELVVPVGYRYS